MVRLLICMSSHRKPWGTKGLNEIKSETKKKKGRTGRKEWEAGLNRKDSREGIMGACVIYEEECECGFVQCVSGWSPLSPLPLLPLSLSLSLSTCPAARPLARPLALPRSRPLPFLPPLRVPASSPHLFFHLSSNLFIIPFKCSCSLHSLSLSLPSAVCMCV